MIETLILDNTERLLSHTPYFAALPKHTIMHSESSAASVTLKPILYNPVLDIFHARNSAVQNSMVRLAPDNFWTGTAAVMTTETSTNILEMALEPGATGRVWGFRKDSAGQDGLWRRTNAVAGTWSKIIGATNNDTQHIYKKTTGDLWYNNATAGNWYQLQDGAAGNAQVTPPAGLHTTPYFPDYWYLNLPDAFVNSRYSFGGQSCNLHYNAVVKVNATVAAPVLPEQPQLANGDPLVLWDNNWTSSPTFAANAVCRLPAELIFYAKPAAQVNAGGSILKTGIIALDSTYLLAIAQYSKGNADAEAVYPNTAFSRFSSQEEPFKTFTRVSLAIINRTTKVVRFVGFVNLPVHSEYQFNATTAEEVYSFECAGARLKSGVLELVSTGTIGQSPGPANVNALLYTQIPLLKLDF